MSVKRREATRSGRALTRIAEGFAVSRCDWLGRYDKESQRRRRDALRGMNITKVKRQKRCQERGQNREYTAAELADG